MGYAQRQAGVYQRAKFILARVYPVQLPFYLTEASGRVERLRLTQLTVALGRVVKIGDRLV